MANGDGSNTALAVVVVVLVAALLVIVFVWAPWRTDRAELDVEITVPGETSSQATSMERARLADALPGPLRLTLS